MTGAGYLLLVDCDDLLVTCGPFCQSLPERTIGDGLKVEPSFTQHAAACDGAQQPSTRHTDGELLLDFIP